MHGNPRWLTIATNRKWMQLTKSGAISVRVRTFHWVLAISVTISLSTKAAEGETASAQTQVELLGTGNPGPTPERSGPAKSIVVNDQASLVDLGRGVSGHDLDVL